MVYFEGTDILPRIEAEPSELVSPDFTPLGKEMIAKFGSELKSAYEAGMSGESLTQEQTKLARLYSDKVVRNVTTSVDSTTIKQHALAGNMDDALSASIDMVNDKIGKTYTRLNNYRKEQEEEPWLKNVANAEVKMHLELKAISGKITHTKMVSNSLVNQKQATYNNVARRNGYKSDLTGKTLTASKKIIGDRGFKDYYVPTTELYDNDDTLLEFYGRIHYGDINITHITITEEVAKEIGYTPTQQCDCSISDKQIEQWKQNGYITMLDYSGRKDTVVKMLDTPEEERRELMILELNNKHLLTDEDKKRLKTFKVITPDVEQMIRFKLSGKKPEKEAKQTNQEPTKTTSGFKVQRSTATVKVGNNNNINTKGV